MVERLRLLLDLAQKVDENNLCSEYLLRHKLYHLTALDGETGDSLGFCKHDSCRGVLLKGREQVRDSSPMSSLNLSLSPPI